MRLGVDVGGTFTDLLLHDERTQRTYQAKTPSTPQDQSIGVAAGVKLRAPEIAIAASAGMARIRHRNWKRDEPGSRFHITYRETNVPTPNVDDRSSSAIVAGIHAKIIFLAKPWPQWEHPIRTLLVRATLIGPERRTLSGGERS